MIQKVVNFSPEWVAGFTRNQWQVYSGMGGSFEPESAYTECFHFILSMLGCTKCHKRKRHLSFMKNGVHRFIPYSLYCCVGLQTASVFIDRILRDTGYIENHGLWPTECGG